MVTHDLNLKVYWTRWIRLFDGKISSI